MSHSSYYYMKSFDDISTRLDENFNNPKFDEIDKITISSKHDIAYLGKSQQELNFEYLTNIVSGTTPKQITYNDNYEIPFVGATSVRNEKVDLSVAPKIKKEIHETTLKNSQIKKDDVLITMAGQYIGRCALFDLDDECNANQAVAILRVNPKKIVPKYLTKYLNSKIGQLCFGKFQHVSSQPNINLDEIVKIPIILPDTTEQTKILKSLEKLEKNLEQTEKGIQEFQIKQNDLILDHLKIKTSTDPDKNYFFKSGKDKASHFFSMSFERLIDRISFHHYQPKLDLINSFSKEFSTIELSKIVSEPIHRGKQPKYSENGIVVIKTVNQKNRHIDFENCLRTSKEFYEDVISAHVKKNDILITSTGYVSMGKIDVFQSNDHAMVDGHIAIIRLIDGYDPYFVTYFLRSHLGMLQFEKWWTGSSGQIEIPTLELEHFVVPDNTDKGVSYEKQIKIAKKISDSIKNEEVLLKNKDNLQKQILQRFEEKIGVN